MNYDILRNPEKHENLESSSYLGMYYDLEEQIKSMLQDRPLTYNS